MFTRGFLSLSTALTVASRGVPTEYAEWGVNLTVVL